MPTKAELDIALGTVRGRPPKDPNLPYNEVKIAIKKAEATARKMEADAGKAELDLEVAQKKYLPREAYREASSTLLAELSQGLRSVPDILERKHNLPPEVVQEIEWAINDALHNVAKGLEMFAGGDER